jgi:hypothetical protein
VSADELAFLTLGLVLGIAVGAALVEVVRSRPRKNGEVRITMTRDAVPARATTLAGAVSPAVVSPAEMGPGDRLGASSRPLDAEDEIRSPAPNERALRDAVGVDAVAVPASASPESTGWADADGGSPIEPYPERATVPYRRRFGPDAPVGIPIHPTPDPALAAINVLVASGARQSRETSVATRTQPERDDAAPLDGPRRIRALSAVLRREPDAIASVAASAARGPEEAIRFAALLGDLADVVATRAADAGFVDTVGYGFWHEFDVIEGRAVVEALAALGFRFDLRDGFVDDLVPAQRDLSLAVAYAGLDPRRLRRWPAERELAALFQGAAVASERYLLASAPQLERHQVEALLGSHGDHLAPLFAAWDRVRPALLASR